MDAINPAARIAHKVLYRIVFVKLKTSGFDMVVNIRIPV